MTPETVLLTVSLRTVCAATRMILIPPVGSIGWGGAALAMVVVPGFVLVEGFVPVEAVEVVGVFGLVEVAGAVAVVVVEGAGAEATVVVGFGGAAAICSFRGGRITRSSPTFTVMPARMSSKRVPCWARIT